MREIIAQPILQNWIDDTGRNKKRYMGKTGVFPCLGAVAYLNGNLKAYAAPGNRNSAFLDLLNNEKSIEGCVVITPIEPDSSEAERIIKAAKKKNIGAICFGSFHPSPKQKRKVFSYLRESGTKVFCLYNDDLVAEMDRRFWVWAKEGRSYIHLKISLTKDGMVVPVPGRKTSLAGPESRERIHRLRGIYDGLLIGGVTVRQDNPQMTYRGKEDLPQPRKIILSRSGKFDPNLVAFNGNIPLICSDEDLFNLTKQLARQNITSILVEGGWQVYKAFIDQQIVDEVSLVWTRKTGSAKGLKLPGKLPYGLNKKVGEDVWEIIRWPANKTGRRSPQKMLL